MFRKCIGVGLGISLWAVTNYTEGWSHYISPPEFLVLIAFITLGLVMTHR